MTVISYTLSYDVHTHMYGTPIVGNIIVLYTHQLIMPAYKNELYRGINKNSTTHVPVAKRTLDVKNVNILYNILNIVSSLSTNLPLNNNFTKIRILMDLDLNVMPGSYKSYLQATVDHHGTL